MANFEPMLATLDKNKERLKIKSYGISDTTLEEVFVLYLDFCKIHIFTLIPILSNNF